MSRRRGARSGVALRVATDIASRYRDIKAAWLAVHNDPTRSVDSLAAEFFFMVGDIMEGRPLRTLKFTNINRDRALAHAEE
jgi:hypothetical protein